VLDATWLRDVQNIEHTKFQNRKVVVRDQGGLTLVTIRVTNNRDLEILKLYVGRALNTTQNFDLGVPQSKSYLKIVHVPFFINNVPITPEFVAEAMKHHKLADNFVLVGPP
jgi:hypothetical protein